jgi:hypothetical protein
LPQGGSYVYLRIKPMLNYIYQRRSTFARTVLFISACMGLFSCDEEEPVVVTERPLLEAFNHELATKWIDLQLDLGKRSPGFSPPVVSRALGYSGVTFYETLVPAMENKVSLVGQLNGLTELPQPSPDEEISYAIAVNAAAAAITREMYENAPVPDLTRIDSLENALQIAYGADIDSDVINTSRAFGQSVAAAVIAWSKTDGGYRGFNRNFPASYVPPVGPGLWKPTNSQLALLPTWGNNRSFVPNLDQVQPSGHPAFSVETQSSFFLEAKQVYDISNSLTEEQIEIAQYWADDPLVTYTPPGHSFAILSELLKQENEDLTDAATLYAQLGIAMSDAFVCCWKIKYSTNLLRPITYIQQHIDPFWSSLIVTPPFPEYTSGHSTQAAACAGILAGHFGDNYTFTDKTHSRLKLGYSPRSFNSFSQMADEVGMSRLYGGIHFPSANLHGKETGYEIAEKVLALQWDE